ncbi:peptide/nickel transport system permease protein [Humitalea rosea]|uniref:Peptide/nickel transport system permease protein n=1 Tax=Humitalea rosea TaxID=990373 RepID=A0A2W7ILY2_9PROT|nr:ABC transporter permease [Humitalea rosea]PZW48067.1 peptide/nickel transport system permease protein [Humitalea rosea]
MGPYILRRVLATIPVMGVVAVIVFLMLRLSPGDPAAILAGDQATMADIAAIRERLGLDQPLLHQFVVWVGELLTGDLGKSIYLNRPVTGLILERVEPTLALSISTMIFAILFAVPMGVVAAWRAGSWVDQTIMGLSVLAFSVPVFLIGYGLVIGFALRLDLLPVQGFVSLWDNPVGFARHLVLPTMTLGLVYMALLARITRATMLDVLNEDFIRTARAKGLAEPRVLILHALKNASVPIVTTIGLGIALLIGGVVVTESVFAIPGIGRLTIEAVLQRDYPVIQGVILAVAGVYVLVNLAIDLTYSALDPRIRF